MNRLHEIPLQPTTSSCDYGVSNGNKNWEQFMRIVNLISMQTVTENDIPSTETFYTHQSEKLVFEEESLYSVTVKHLPVILLIHSDGTDSILYINFY